MNTVDPHCDQCHRPQLYASRTIAQLSSRLISVLTFKHTPLKITRLSLCFD